MEEIIKNPERDYTIMRNKNLYIIEFKTLKGVIPLVNSLIKTNIIQGASRDETYKKIKFTAASVKTLREYQNDMMKKRNKNNLLVSEVAKMIRNLSSQLYYLIDNESHTILGYNIDDIIVINDEKFAYLGSELVANINEESELAMISCPFSYKDFFFSPELFSIKEIPYYVNYKIAYFSFGLMIIYCLLGNDEFYNEYLKHKQTKKLLDELKNHPIKDTRIFWLLSRCLAEEPNDRSIILI